VFSTAHQTDQKKHLETCHLHHLSVAASPFQTQHNKRLKNFEPTAISYLSARPCLSSGQPIDQSLSKSPPILQKLADRGPSSDLATLNQTDHIPPPTPVFRTLSSYTSLHLNTLDERCISRFEQSPIPPSSAAILLPRLAQALCPSSTIGLGRQRAGLNSELPTIRNQPHLPH